MLDDVGDPVPDALIDIWQAGLDGAVSKKTGSLHRDGHTFTGWGRAATDNAGAYWFSTLRPGSAAADGVPYFAITVFARGLLNRLFTRVYLPAVVRDTADRLGLTARRSWHTSRSPLTATTDALIGYTDLLGHMAADVATLSRPEIGELSEPADGVRGGSSTMPNKRNPVLAVLIRRAALAAPMVGATLHLAAAAAVDERPDGAGHTEWATARILVRRTVVAASQATELLTGLAVDPERMAETLRSALPSILAERRSMQELTVEDRSSTVADDDPSNYLGAASSIVADVVTRARTHLSEKA